MCIYVRVCVYTRACVRESMYDRAVAEKGVSARETVCVRE